MRCSTFTNDYVTQQARHFGARRRVADEQPFGTSQNGQSDCFSNFSYTNLARGYAIREQSAAKSQQIISIDYKNGITYILVGMLSVHDGEAKAP